MGFTIVGMNIGTNEADYALLMDRKTPMNDTLDSYLDKFMKEPTEENMQIVLKKIMQDKNINLNDIDTDKEKILALILFDAGLDVVENLLTQTNNDKIKALIEKYPKELDSSIKEKVKDSYGLNKFKENYPNLANQYLPQTIWKQFLGIITSFFKEKNNQIPQEHRHMKDIRDKLAINYFTKLVKRQNKPEVIAIQELKNENQSVTDVLEKANYEIYRSSDNDTAIALDTARFNYKDKYENQEAFGIVAEDKQTNQKYIFISIHNAPVDLDVPQQRDKETDEDFNVRLRLYNDKNKGLIDTGINLNTLNQIALIKAMKEQNPGAMVIMQGDFNVSPEFFEKKEVDESIKKMNPFKHLTKQLDLTVVDPGQATELYRPSENSPERKLDFGLVSNDLKDRVKVINHEDQELSLVKKDEKGLHFDPMLLFSDHAPIEMRIENKA